MTFFVDDATQLPVPMLRDWFGPGGWLVTGAPVECIDDATLYVGTPAEVNVYFNLGEGKRVGVRAYAMSDGRINLYRNPAKATLA